MGNNEPVITTAAIVAAVTAGITLLVSFGVPLTPDQQTAILGAVAVLAPFALAFVARNFTVSFNRAVAYETKSGNIVAGPAAVQETGTPIVVIDPTDDESGESDLSHPEEI